MAEEDEKPASAKKVGKIQRRRVTKGGSGKIPKAIEEKNADNPMPSQDLCRGGWLSPGARLAISYLLRSANLYGLASGTGISASISLTKLGQDVVAPSSPRERAGHSAPPSGMLRTLKLLKSFTEGNVF